MISNLQALTQVTLGATPTTPVPITWPFLLSTDLTVVQTRANVDTTLTLNVGYTVTGGGATPATGTIVPITSLNGDVLTIYRSVPDTQLLSLTNLTSFPATSVETNFDRITMQLQTIQNKLDRTLYGPISGPVLAALPSATSRISKYLGFDASGVPTLLDGTAATALTKNSIELNAGLYQLVGDAASPGNSMLYGTNGSGTRGWYAQPTNVLPAMSVGTSGLYLTNNGAAASWAGVTNLATVRTIGGSNFDGSANVTSFPSPGAIGATTPGTGAFTTLSATGFVSLNQSGGTAPAQLGSQDCLHLAGAAGASAGAYFDCFGVGGTTSLAFINGRSARGTIGSKTASQLDDVLFLLGGVGYGATGYASGSRSNIRFVATENWTDSAQGARIDFYATPTGSAGNTLIGSWTATGLAVTGTLAASTITSGSGVASTTGDLFLNSGATNLYGPRIVYQRNSVNKWNLGLESGIIGNNNETFILYDNAASAIALKYTTSTGLSVTGVGSFTGDLAIGTTAAATVLTIGTGTASSWSRLRMRGSNTQLAWEISSNNFLADRLQFTPSTTNGGTTFTTSVVDITTTGLDVTGTLSVSGIARSTVTSGNYFLANSATTGAMFWRVSNTSGDVGMGTEGSAGGAILPGTPAYEQVIFYKVGKGLTIGSSTMVARVSDTGLAVTGVGSFSGAVTASTVPTIGGHLCNKTYVDSVASGGLKVHVACRLGTVASLPTYTGSGTNTLTASANGVLSVDGVTVVAADRILVKNGAATKDNGVYDVSVVGTAGTPWVLVRSAAEDTSAEMPLNAYFLITAGTLVNTAWVVSTTPTTMNTDPLLFAQYTQSSSYLAGTGLVLTGSTFSIDTAIVMQKASNLSDVSSRITAKSNLYLIGVNVMDYGADNTGVADSTSAFASAIAACSPTGGIYRVELASPIGGYGTPSSTPATAWAARPAITSFGGFGSGFAALGNINYDGFLSSVEVSSVGSGERPLAYVCSRTAGSPNITYVSGGAGSFDAAIISGSTISVMSEGMTTSCVVVTRTDSTHLVLSENCLYTNSDEMIFGMPQIRLAGVVEPRLIPIVGIPLKLVVPPGMYNLPTGIGNIGGKSNLTIEATGAQFTNNSTTGAVGVNIRNSTGITFNEGCFYFKNGRYSDPGNASGRSSRYAGQSGMIIACCRAVEVNRTKIHNSFMFGVHLSAGADVANTWATRRVQLNDLSIVNPLGDGIHIDMGVINARIKGIDVINPGDDALAVTGATASTPAALVASDIVFSDCTITGGVYRGCLAAGGSNITFRNIKGIGTNGPFCWAGVDGTYVAPSNVTFENITGMDLGDTSYNLYKSGTSGIGITATTMTGLVLRNLNFTRHSTASAQTTDLYNITEANITNLDSDRQELTSTGTTTTYTGSLNTDLDCQGANGFATVTLTPGRWLVTGNIAARYSAIGNGMYAVVWDGTTEYSGGSAWLTGDQSLRANLPVTAFVNVISGTKVVRIRIKQNGGGVIIDAGASYGPNSYLQANRI
jgi:hypothetical protein